MWSYFKPLRRKIGVVTLVLACASMALWVRGSIRPVRIVIPGGKYIEYVMMADAQSLHFSKEEQIWFGIRVTPNVTLAEFRIPHWSIAVPLTAVSAWSLLSKPRAKSEQFDAEDEEP